MKGTRLSQTYQHHEDWWASVSRASQTPWGEPVSGAKNLYATRRRNHRSGAASAGLAVAFLRVAGSQWPGSPRQNRTLNLRCACKQGQHFTGKCGSEEEEPASKVNVHVWGPCSGEQPWIYAALSLPLVSLPWLWPRDASVVLWLCGHVGSWGLWLPCGGRSRICTLVPRPSSSLGFKTRGRPTFSGPWFWLTDSSVRWRDQIGDPWFYFSLCSDFNRPCVLCLS